MERHHGSQEEKRSGWHAVGVARSRGSMQSGGKEVGDGSLNGWEVTQMTFRNDHLISLLSQPRMKPASITDNSMKRPQHPATTNPCASQPTKPTTKIILPVTTTNSSTITSPITTT
ncbi:hypothetical protein Pmani_034932 [Petrolisthes manimaculis]|uniref:Uncharacterized protein n=1 Tax=Petrolisthes manimaculis TaxID=1843537 RepID=A0AAE1NLS1_9EUCA|nr:hypothetical protein Pmani_034932 [Petrolisthes manimaculis]